MSSCLLITLIGLFPYLHFFFPPIPRHLPDQALSSKLTIKFWIDALAAKVDIETLAALPTEPGLMFLTDSDCLPIGMASTLHISLRFLAMIAGRWRGYIDLRHQLLFLDIIRLVFNRLEIGRCLKST